MAKRYELIALRKKENLLQKDVVSYLRERFGIEITESFYGMIEQGVRNPRLETALAIANLFGADVYTLFFGPNHNKKLG